MLINRYDSLVFKYSNIVAVKSLRIPLLILHGTKDKEIPYRHGKDLMIEYYSSNSCDVHHVSEHGNVSFNTETGSQQNCLQSELYYKLKWSRLVEVEGASHNDVHTYPEWFLAVDEFLRSLDRY
jgi:hypothetical protein